MTKSKENEEIFLLKDPQYLPYTLLTGVLCLSSIYLLQKAKKPFWYAKKDLYEFYAYMLMGKGIENSKSAANSVRGHTQTTQPFFQNFDPLT